MWHLPLRVRAVWRSDHKEGTARKVEAPHASVEPAGIQVPDSETLGQSQPGGEVLGVLHLDEQQPCLALLPRVEVF